MNMESTLYSPFSIVKDFSFGIGAKPEVIPKKQNGEKHFSLFILIPYGIVRSFAKMFFQNVNVSLLTDNWAPGNRCSLEESWGMHTGMFLLSNSSAFP